MTLAVVCALGSLNTPASAAEGENVSLAQALFDEGVALMQANRFAEACPKLQESMRLDPAGGTALDVAFCLEKVGRLASALAAYKDAERRALLDHRTDRVSQARERAAMLSPSVPRVEIIADQLEEGTTIELDDAALGAEALARPIPLDPGRHRVSARASRLASWEESFVVSAAPEVVTVRVPRLTTRRSETPAPTTRGNRRVALALFGVGAAALVVGGTFGVAAMVTHGRADCAGDTCASQRDLDLEARADRFAWASNVGLGVAAVSVVAGVIAYFATAPRARAAAD